MEIYGLAFVGLCMFLGSTIGVTLGKILGISGNVGGVGFAMLIMVIATNYLEKSGNGFSEKTQKGILLLSSLYIPVVVAMSSIQNVVAAINGGAVAFLAGGIATIGSLFLIPIIMKLVGGKDGYTDSVNEKV
ncbi:malonate transporter subunit MadL [uncultured Ilyobacter sp.]|jgi:malonate transporter MadL subunit|nr:malonate transporter subunit MadL [uncultured Ilyobacter sp.]